MTDTVLVGIDGSATGREALRFALSEASLRGAALRVVHAWMVPPLTTTGVGIIPVLDELEAELEESAAEAIGADLERVGAGGVEIERLTPRGDAAGTLLELSAGAHLLVVGSRGRGAVAGAVLGSVSRACLLHATCPVAVVHVSYHSEHARIVVGADGSPGAAAALEWAFAEARRRGSAVHAVSAYHERWSLSAGVVASPGAALELTDALAENARRILDDVRGAAPEGVRVTVESVASAPGPALVAAAADGDLLVVGSRGRGGFASLLLGSVSQYCAAHAGGAVVVVRPR
jgi:nucleotide-binding universal stress UspA family protein